MADFSLDNPDDIVSLLHLTIGVSSMVEYDSQLSIPYKAVSQPRVTGTLSIYQFSLDNNEWFPMLPSTGTQLTGLDPCVNWKDFEFTWLFAGATGIQGSTALQGDTSLGDTFVFGETGIEGSIYDKDIWIKLRMDGGDLHSTAVQKVYPKNTDVNSNLSDRAPSSYEGMGSLDVLKQAPHKY